MRLYYRTTIYTYTKLTANTSHPPVHQSSSNLDKFSMSSGFSSATVPCQFWKPPLSILTSIGAASFLKCSHRMNCFAADGPRT